MKPITAILYTSNTGFTAQYARLLARITGIPAYHMAERKDLPAWGTSALYLGWLCAGKIKGLSAARKRYQVQAVCAVGMAPPDSEQGKSLPTSNHLNGLPLFYLQGGYAPDKLKGISKVMMGAMSRAVTSHPPKDDAERERQQAFQSGRNWVSEAALAPVLAWLEQQS